MWRKGKGDLDSVGINSFPFPFSAGFWSRGRPYRVRVDTRIGERETSMESILQSTE